MRTFYVDESGYTGEDLLNADQPVFAQGTNDFTTGEANKIIASTFSGIAAAELKYSRLAKSRRNQDRIVELIRIIAGDPTRAAFWISHKEFAMMTFIVDWWLEPFAYQRGLNLYKDGGNLAMTNMLYSCLPGFWSAGFRHRLLLLFQRMMRARTRDIYIECESFVHRAISKATGEQIELIRYFWLSFEALGHQHILELPNRVLDLALPGLVFIGHTWRSRHGEDLELVHDQSTNMAKRKWLWDALSSPSIAEATFAHRGGTHAFPMNVGRTRFADSTQEKQLQICDILAGAASAFVRGYHKRGDEAAYHDKLIEAGIERLHIGGLWPSTDVTAEQLGTKGLDPNQAIEWVSEQLKNAHRSAE